MKSLPEHTLTVRYEHQILRLTLNHQLISYLRQPGNQAYRLAVFLRRRYHSLQKEPLRISTHSLAIEILCHVAAQKLFSDCRQFFRRFLPIPCILSFLDSMLRHTAVIDCGDRAQDSNRIVWDLLVPFRALLYRLFAQS